MEKVCQALFVYIISPELLIIAIDSVMESNISKLFNILLLSYELKTMPSILEWNNGIIGKQLNLSFNFII
tara:strand:+ start:1316 stop:1525 length:210 start_codon:yes stop_codon:yes gene_type:complete